MMATAQQEAKMPGAITEALVGALANEAGATLGQRVELECALLALVELGKRTGCQGEQWERVCSALGVGEEG